jgi:hypothetical protein
MRKEHQWIIIYPSFSHTHKLIFYFFLTKTCNIQIHMTQGGQTYYKIGKIPFFKILIIFYPIFDWAIFYHIFKILGVFFLVFLVIMSATTKYANLDENLLTRSNTFLRNFSVNPKSTAKYEKLIFVSRWILVFYWIIDQDDLLNKSYYKWIFRIMNNYGAIQSLSILAENFPI